MQCFQLCALIFLITVLQLCAAYPLGIRAHALGKQFDSLKDKKLDYYELDDDAENEFDEDDNDDDVGSNDRIDHYLHDAIDVDDEDEVNDESFDKTDDNHEDDDADNVENEMYDDNGVEIDFSAPTKSLHYSNADHNEDDEISGYRPDVALTSPLEYYS